MVYIFPWQIMGRWFRQIRKRLRLEVCDPGVSKINGGYMY